MVVIGSPTSHRWHHKSFRHRAISAGLSVLFVALFFLALLGISGVPLVKPPKPQETVVFDLPAPAPAAPKAERTPSKSAEKQASAAPVVAPPVPPIPRPPTPPPPPTPPKPTSDIIPVSPSEFAALDIRRLKKSGSGSSGSGSKGTYGPGQGPGGKSLYPADWYVEPRNGELAQYLPNGAPDGSWAMIACRTAPKYAVENCYGLGESSPGLSRALRLASWQFKVLPPRIDGKPQIGVWVKIRFDFSTKQARE